MSTRKNVLLLLGMASCIVLSGCTQHDAKVAVGDRFPELNLFTLDGAPASTADYRGRAMLINVWATWCPPCRKEMPALQRLAQALALEKANLRVIGVALDDDDHLVREMLIAMGVTFPNYLGTAKSAVQEKLTLQSFPQTFLVGEDGRLRGRIEGGREWDTSNMRTWLRERLDGNVTQVRANAERSKDDEYTN